MLSPKPWNAQFAVSHTKGAHLQMRKLTTKMCISSFGGP